MKILTELEIKENVNTFHGMSPEQQQKLRMENWYFILELSSIIGYHISKHTVSAAMLLTSFFYVKKDYLEYDRLQVWTAALFYASKLFNELRRIDYYILAYHKMLNKMEGIENPPPLEEMDKEDICKGLLHTELTIAKVMFENEGDVIGNDLPYSYIVKYSTSMFSTEDWRKLIPYVTGYINDTFFTTLPLLFDSKEIALACVLISMQQLDIKINLIDESKWYRMVSEHWEFEDVLDWIKHISQFYIQHKLKEEEISEAVKTEWQKDSDHMENPESHKAECSPDKTIN